MALCCRKTHFFFFPRFVVKNIYTYIYFFLNSLHSHGWISQTRLTIIFSQENAVNGEHLWLETNVSGDLCYLGEESCQVKFSVSCFQIFFSLSEVTSLTSDWYSAQMFRILNCLLLLKLVFQKECKRGRRPLVKCFVAWKIISKQFWVAQNTYTVRMDVISSFINMVREKRLKYWDVSEIFRESSLFYLCTEIYHLLGSLRIGSDQIFGFNHCKNLNWIFQTLECTHQQWVQSYLSVCFLFENIRDLPSPIEAFLLCMKKFNWTDLEAIVYPFIDYNSSRWLQQLLT